MYTYANEVEKNERAQHWGSRISGACLPAAQLQSLLIYCGVFGFRRAEAMVYGPLGFSQYERGGEGRLTNVATHNTKGIWKVAVAWVDVAL